MNDPAPHAARFHAGLGAGLALALALAWAWLAAATAGGTEARERKDALAAAHALAAKVEAAGATEASAAGAVAAWQKAQRAGTVARVVLVDGARLAASTDPADAGETAAPRRLRLEEKALFDRAKRLRGIAEENAQGVQKTSEEDASRREDGSWQVAVPIRRAGAVVGAADVERPAAPPAASGGSGPGPGGRALAALLALALPLAAFAPARRLRGPWAPAAVAVALFAIGFGTFAAWASRATGGAGDGVSALSASAVAGLLALGVVGSGIAERGLRALSKNRVAYAYTLPAMVGMVVLVFFPFFYGIVLSFTGQTIFNVNEPLSDLWVGFTHYKDILGDLALVKRVEDGSLALNYGNFYWTLIFTVVWTVTNVAIGVSVGLVLALALNVKGLALRPVYRVLLILPWAMPNYITALIWKGMFHRQFGVVNYTLMLLGFEPISWFDGPFTSFLTALATNGWLSFPFMMVVSLGALQSIPADLYEAARVDGATRWQQFRSITLPSLKPALVPAIILSVVWTFNMFNIIFLVTAGEPGGATEILITQAYKYAFQQYRYGYAAAYSTVIFALLLTYGIFQNRVTRATEGI